MFIVRKMEIRQGPICDKRTHDGTGNKFGGGVSGLTVMLSDRGRTMGWNCRREYSVSFKKMLVITILTFSSGGLGMIFINFNLIDKKYDNISYIIVYICIF